MVEYNFSLVYVIRAAANFKIYYTIIIGILIKLQLFRNVLYIIIV